MASFFTTQTIASVALQGLLFALPVKWIGGMSWRRWALLALLVLIVFPPVSLALAEVVLRLGEFVAQIGVVAFVAVSAVLIGRAS